MMKIPADPRGGRRCRRCCVRRGSARRRPRRRRRRPPALTPQQQNEEMLKELRAIRMLLEKISTPQPAGRRLSRRPAKVTNLKGYALGRPDAPLTMVEFTDLQCPFCRQFALDVVRRDQEELDRHRQAALHQPRLPARLPRAGDARRARRALRRRAGQVLGDAPRPDAEREPADARLHHEDRGAI